MDWGRTAGLPGGAQAATGRAAVAVAIAAAPWRVRPPHFGMPVPGRAASLRCAGWLRSAVRIRCSVWGRRRPGRAVGGSPSTRTVYRFLNDGAPGLSPTGTPKSLLKRRMGGPTHWGTACALGGGHGPRMSGGPELPARPARADGAPIGEEGGQRYDVARAIRTFLEQMAAGGMSFGAAVVKKLI